LLSLGSDLKDKSEPVGLLIYWFWVQIPDHPLVILNFRSRVDISLPSFCLLPYNVQVWKNWSIFALLLRRPQLPFSQPLSTYPYGEATQGVVYFYETLPYGRLRQRERRETPVVDARFLCRTFRSSLARVRRLSTSLV
jgi:hypothetical protein